MFRKTPKEDDKINHAKYLISRFDHYYDSTNNKGNLFLVLNTFLLGGLSTAYFSLVKEYNFTCWTYPIIVLLVASGLFSILCTLKAILPYTSSNGTSLAYFGDIAHTSQSNFKKRFKEQSDLKLQEDLVNQIYILAKGLKRKFFFLKVAGILIGTEFIFLLLFLISLKSKP